MVQLQGDPHQVLRCQRTTQLFVQPTAQQLSHLLQLLGHLTKLSVNVCQAIQGTIYAWRTQQKQVVQVFKEQSHNSQTQAADTESIHTAAKFSKPVEQVMLFALQTPTTLLGMLRMLHQLICTS
jgi:phage-related minor tail protein